MADPIDQDKDEKPAIYTYTNGSTTYTYTELFLAEEVSRFSEPDAGQWYCLDENTRYIAGTDETNDAIKGFERADFIYASTGNDLVWGMEHSDILAGQDGNDILIGNSGRDTLSGHVGDDILVGDNWVDTIAGTLTVNGEPLKNHSTDLDQANNGDFLYGGGGDDILYGGEDGDELNGGAGNDLLYGGVDDDELNGDIDHDTLYGGVGKDELNGGAGSDLLKGGVGDDQFYGGSGKDVLHGEEGVDHLRGESGNDVLYGGDARDTLEGGAGNDFLYGGSVGDTLKGGAGDDILAGGEGEDTLFGGEGKDRFVVKTSDSGDTIHDFRNGTDSDKIEIVVDSLELLTRFWDNEDNLIGYDALTFDGDIENDKAYLKIYYTDKNYVKLQNFSYNDKLSAADFQFSASIPDIGGTVSTPHDDIIEGTDENNLLFDSKGENTIIGKKGDDTLNGGPDRDKFVFSRGDGHDTINFYDPANGDSISFEFAAGVLELATDVENRKYHEVAVTKGPSNKEGISTFKVYYGDSDLIELQASSGLMAEDLNFIF